jgi:uncharacterized membrane protein YkoI
MEFMMYKPVFPLLVLAAGVSQALASEPSSSQLQAMARISQEQATRTALARAPNSKVQSVELEREHGKLVWSFDLAQAGRSGVSEIQVDAVTGRIVSQQRESAAKEASELSRERKEK